MGGKGDKGKEYKVGKRKGKGSYLESRRFRELC